MQGGGPTCLPWLSGALDLSVPFLGPGPACDPSCTSRSELPLRPTGTGLSQGRCKEWVGRPWLGMQTSCGNSLIYNFEMFRHLVQGPPFPHLLHTCKCCEGLPLAVTGEAAGAASYTPISKDYTGASGPLSWFRGIKSSLYLKGLALLQECSFCAGRMSPHFSIWSPD